MLVLDLPQHWQNAFERFDYSSEVGLGVYDIHSPRVPDSGEMLKLLRIPLERLWGNPDYGLKTRA